MKYGIKSLIVILIALNSNMYGQDTLVLPTNSPIYVFSKILEDKICYNINIQGTWSAWRDLYQSGIDAFYCYNAPSYDPRKGQEPFLTNCLRINDKIYPQPPPYSNSHNYNLSVIGDGSSYSFHIKDTTNGSPTYQDNTGSLIIIITRQILPRIVISGKNKLCAGDSAVLFTRQIHESYLWSTGDTTSKIVVKAPGTYSVTVVDSNGCQGVDQVEILPGDIAAPEVSKSGGVPCIDVSVILRAKGHYYSYEWIDSLSGAVISRTDSVVIGKSGKYYLRVGDSAGCSAVSGTEEILLGPSDDVLEIITPSGGNLVKFDSSALGKISCREVVIRNKGLSAYSVRRVRLSGNIFFSAPEGQFPIEIQPGEMQELLICFSSRDTSYHKDSVYIDDLCSTHIIGLGGTGVRNILDGNTRCGSPVSIESFSTGLQGIEFSEPYPNPASDILFIGLKYGSEELRPQEEVVVNVKIFNSIGEACFDRHYKMYPSSIGKDDPGNELKLGLAGLEPGYYFLRVMQGGRIWSRPVLIWR